MTKRIVKNLELLKALNKCNKPEQKKLLKVIRPEVVNAICDCVQNILKGKIPISSSEKRLLQSKKNVLRQLVDRKNKTVKRKKLLAQHGAGFLGALIGPAIAALTLALQK